MTISIKEKLSALREQMTAQGLDAFLVPLADEFQGEYIPPSAQRLQWLTGFTGSAGLAVVTRQKAAIFVDGRYTLQARQEVSESLFEHHHITDSPPGKWLENTLKKHTVLGFDPWLHTPNGIKRLEDVCSRAAITLEAVETNPVDMVWTDRPQPPAGEIMPLDKAFTGKTTEEKCKEIAASLKEKREDAAVLSAPDSLAWLLNVRGSDLAYSPLPLSFGIIHADGAVEWFVDERKITDATRRHLHKGVKLSTPAEFTDALAALGKKEKSVRLDFSQSPEAVRTILKDAGANVISGDDPCALPKACKNETELAGIRQAHLRDGAALTRFLAWLKTHEDPTRITEVSAAGRLEELRRENEHFQGLSFPTIAGAGPNGAIVHYHASEDTARALETGSLLLVDSGAQYLDGTTDVTRTIAIKDPSAEMRRNFTRVLKGHIALACIRFPKGTTGSQLDAFARAPLWQAGLDYDHGTGHGVGHFLNVHEGPQRISKVGSSVDLRPGMVISNEPGYYKEGAYGIRIENLVAVVSVDKPDGAERDLYGFETLTLAPIDRDLIEIGLLNSEERAWLNAYHKRVQEKLSKLVDEETRAWLDKVTEPV